jgi:3D (Asp-Asp-Asp) domain-containing protein
VSAAIALVLNATRANLPAMAVVDEVRLVQPEAAETDTSFRAESPVASNWDARDSYRPIKGNIIGVPEEAVAARVVETSFRSPEVNSEVSPRRIEVGAAPAGSGEFANDPNIRWFNARPVRPAKTMWMEVTGYSPDAKSCGDSADGITATLHSVTTNAMRMVAADTTVLPYGSLVSVPGYDEASIVPVLDCGGAIKGAKLDLLFATDKEAMKWGRQRVLVTVWQYADGKPAEDVRKVR